MNTQPELSNIVDDCLDLMFSEAASLDHCLSLHPQAATELAPLLSIAAAVRVGAAAYPAAAATVLSRDMLRAAIQSAAEHDLAQSNSRWSRASAFPAGVQRFVFSFGRRGIRASNDDHELAGMVDTCLRSVMDDGVPLDASLKPFRDRAAELEPLLTLATESRKTVHEIPSDRSVIRSRRRLANEILWSATDGISSTTRRFALPSIGFGRRVAAASAVAALLVIGIAAVASSRGALPGDMLYPVKLGSEQAQESLATSSAARAELALQLTERRTSELATLLQQGRYEDAAEGREHFRRQIAEAAAIVAEQSDATARRELQLELEHITQSSLGQLDAIAMASLNRNVAFELVQSAALAYSDAVETAGASNGLSQSAQVSGLLDLQLMDADASGAGIESFLVEITRIEVRRAGVGDDEWSTVLDRSATFDLLDASNAGAVSLDLAAGTYTRLRLTLGTATITSGGVSRTADPVNAVVTLSRPLAVREGLTSTSILDFDLEQSMVQDGSGAFAFEPVILLRSGESAREPSATLPRSAPEEPGVEATETEPPQPLDDGKAAGGLPSLDDSSVKDQPIATATSPTAPGDDHGKTLQSQREARDAAAAIELADDEADEQEDLEADSDSRINHGEAVRIARELVGLAVVDTSDPGVESDDSEHGNSGKGNASPSGAKSTGGAPKTTGDSDGQGSSHAGKSNNHEAESDGGGHGKSRHAQGSSAADNSNNRDAKSDGGGHGKSSHTQGSSAADNSNNRDAESDGGSHGNSSHGNSSHGNSSHTQGSSAADNSNNRDAESDGGSHGNSSHGKSSHTQGSSAADNSSNSEAGSDGGSQGNSGRSQGVLVEPDEGGARDPGTAGGAAATDDDKTRGTEHDIGRGEEPGKGGANEHQGKFDDAHGKNANDQDDGGEDDRDNAKSAKPNKNNPSVSKGAKPA